MNRILVIEDSPAIGLLLRRRLEMAGYSIDVVPEGKVALERLEEGLVPDLVLADVQMPGLDGLETLARIRRSHGDLPVILVTGQELNHGQREQANAVFAKLIEFEPLLEKIEDLI